VHVVAWRLLPGGLEGVVAKRLGSTYLPGRRWTSWVKHRLRREERLAVTGVRRSPEGKADAVFVARHPRDGSLTSAGSIELGLRPELVEEIRAATPRAPNPPPRRNRVISDNRVRGRVLSRPPSDGLGAGV
jgi:bifunctional non-homologous end joining protein LigD